MRTSHIGSLPFTDIQKALNYTMQFDLPVLFSLPNLRPEEFMPEVIKKYHAEESFDQSFYCEDFFNQHKGEYKYQIIGAFSLYHTSSKRVPFDTFLTRLKRNYLDHFKTVLRFDANCVLFFDEPFLNFIDLKKLEQLNRFYLNIKDELKLKLGIHICCKINELILNKLELDLINIDSNLNEFHANSYGIDSSSKINKDCELITPRCGLALKNIGDLENIKNCLNQYRDQYSLS